MAKIVEVHVRGDFRLGPRIDPVVPEVAAPPPSALGAKEDVAVPTSAGEAVEVLPAGLTRY